MATTREDKTIQLFVFPGCWGLPSTSPFCIKMDAWLRVANLAFEVNRVDNPAKGPKKKAPWIEFEGPPLGDSTLIAAHLSERFGLDVDAHLGREERAQSLAMQLMLEEHYYQVILYTHFIRDEGWAVTKESLFEVPAFIRPLIGFVMRRGVRKDAYMRGMARHSHDDIIEFGKKDMRALSTLLGETPFFFGEKPSSFDACAYGFLAMTLRCPVKSAVRTEAENLGNLSEFLDRFEARFYTNRAALAPATGPHSLAA